MAVLVTHQGGKCGGKQGWGRRVCGKEKKFSPKWISFQVFEELKIERPNDCGQSREQSRMGT